MTDKEKLAFIKTWAEIAVDEDESDLNKYGEGYRDAAAFILRVLSK